MLVQLIILAFSLVAAASMGFLAGKYFGRRGTVTEGRLRQAEADQQKELIAHTIEREKLLAQVKITEEKLAAQERERGKTRNEWEQHFRLLAQTILEEKSEKFTTNQQQNLRLILDPLKEQLQAFREDYERKRSKESEERISLREQVKQMMELNLTLSKEANNLTNALKGNVKKQGDWGELILESVLQFAGLKKNLHYFLQQHSHNLEDRRIRPDVIVRYPDQRNIIVDSKVSLVHYEAYCSATETDDQKTALEQLLRSFKNHVDGLTKKNYTDITDALDMVIMFVPVEGAFITIAQADPQFWEMAYRKKVLIASPTLLIMVMKLIADLWQRETINEESHQLAERAGRIYEKLTLFLENFSKVGVQIQKAMELWQTAEKQLTTGKGNAIAQLDHLRKFHNKPSKNSFLKTVVQENDVEPVIQPSPTDEELAL